MMLDKATREELRRRCEFDKSYFDGCVLPIDADELIALLDAADVLEGMRNGEPWVPVRVVTREQVEAEYSTPPPSPPPLVWRRLADEWPDEGAVVWAWSPRRAEYGVRPAVVLSTRLRFLNGEEWGGEGRQLSRGGCWLPAAVPTPPAPEGETTA